MRKAALLLLLGLSVLGSGVRASDDDDFGEAVRQSLERARQQYPEAARPNSPLSRAILARIGWLRQNDPSFFSNPDWPMELTAAQAAAMGFGPEPAAATPEASPEETASTRYLAQVTHSFSVVGASFRKGQQIVLEQLRDYNKRAITMVDGQPILIWLDNLKILRALPPNLPDPVVVKIESARYGLAGQMGYSVSSIVQSLISPDTSGHYEILASDALLSPGAASRLNRSPQPPTGNIVDPQTGQITGTVTSTTPQKVLTVTYTINGEKKTKQATEGETMVLD